tara:strand:- start:349 stop:594 length:246 start_codon:yes stop_codon:yes gene_type:complete
MSVEKNTCGKTVDVAKPYEVWETNNGNWQWKVLKKYQKPSKEKNNPYARWLCAVKSPYTHDTYDYGDVYVKEIKDVARQVA